MGIENFYPNKGLDMINSYYKRCDKPSSKPVCVHNYNGDVDTNDVFEFLPFDVDYRFEIYIDIKPTGTEYMFFAFDGYNKYTFPNGSTYMVFKDLLVLIDFMNSINDMVPKIMC